MMRSLGYPVVYDATHSLQLPGALATASGAQREYAPHLLRAAVAVGVDALFMEVHPDPDRAWSDVAAQLPLASVAGVLEAAVRIRQCSVLGEERRARCPVPGARPDGQGSSPGRRSAVVLRREPGAGSREPGAQRPRTAHCERSEHSDP
jgi:hypothetical protein